MFAHNSTRRIDTFHTDLPVQSKHPQPFRRVLRPNGDVVWERYSKEMGDWRPVSETVFDTLEEKFLESYQMPPGPPDLSDYPRE